MQSNAFLKPRIIDVQSTSPFHAKVVMEPFERGYGHTLGNALRRMLLSSMPGYAPDRGQDRRRAARVFDDRRRAGRRGRHPAEPEGRGVQAAQSRRRHADADQGRRGRGHGCRHRAAARRRDHQSGPRDRPSDGRRQDRDADQGREGPRLRAGQPCASADEDSKTIGRIVLDASFSPVRRVSYTVESARVEQRTDLDKLVMDIETNGAIEPEEAVRYSARILVEQLSVFAALEGTAEPVLSQRTCPRSIRSCCARSTIWSSRCARPTA